MVMTQAAQAVSRPVPAIRIRGLTRRFGKMTAVDALDLDVPAGSLFGLVGPNGAGKTTTLSMVTGVLRPDAGTVSLFGTDVWTDPPATKARTGVLPDGPAMFDRLSGAELIEYAGRLRGLPRADARSRAGDLLRVLGLRDSADNLVVDYSAGMKKKIGLACALVHSPRLLVLDEPFESVDPVSSETIRSLLRDYAAAGGTVVLSSHVMEVVETLCTDLAVVAAGRVLAEGSVAAVRGEGTLQQRFLALVGGVPEEAALTWLGSSSG
jgi:ABC-2 type transport system ATP-binding protein